MPSAITDFGLYLIQLFDLSTSKSNQSTSIDKIIFINIISYKYKIRK